MDIPRAAETVIKLDRGEKLNPLEQFVYNYACRSDDIAKFRRDLGDVLEWCKQTTEPRNAREELAVVAQIRKPGQPDMRVAMQIPKTRLPLSMQQSTIPADLDTIQDMLPPELTGTVVAVEGIRTCITIPKRRDV